MAEKIVNIKFSFRADRAIALAGFALCSLIGLWLIPTSTAKSVLDGPLWISGLLCGAGLGFWVWFLLMGASSSTTGAKDGAG